MSESRLGDFIDHMLEASRLACSYVADMSREVFLADKRTQQAVVLNLIVIGEAATRISGGHPAFVAQHAEIPWKNMKGMRNRVAHGYFDIDLSIVWDTVHSALPELIVQLDALRTSLPGEGRSGNGDVNS